MLVQQYRYDMSWQQDPAAGNSTANYGVSRGLEIISTTRLEVGIFPPRYLVHQPSPPDGFGDLSFQVKYPAFSATEGRGDVPPTCKLRDPGEKITCWPPRENPANLNKRQLGNLGRTDQQENDLIAFLATATLTDDYNLLSPGKTK